MSGYLKDWKADIGTMVHAGQVLAGIEAPDVDQSRDRRVTEHLNELLQRPSAVACGADEHGGTV